MNVFEKIISSSLKFRTESNKVRLPRKNQVGTNRPGKICVVSGRGPYSLFMAEKLPHSDMYVVNECVLTDVDELRVCNLLKMAGVGNDMIVRREKTAVHDLIYGTLLDFRNHR